MAHFAILDENDIVINVVVVSNDDILDENGEECEHSGECFCKEILLRDDIRAVQTSYNANFRKKFASIGDKYLEEYDVFISPQPYPSATLNMTTFSWDPPVPKPENPPENFVYLWDENLLNWQLRDIRPPFVEVSNEMFRRQLTLEEKILWDNPETASETKKPFIVTAKLDLPTTLRRDEPNEVFELLVSKNIFTRTRIDTIIQNLFKPSLPPLPPITEV